MGHDGAQMSAGAPTAAAASRDAIGVSIVSPTFNEKANIAPLLERIEAALGPTGWEIVFIDDASPDGTASEVREHARRDRRVRVVERHGRRGLASAVVEGAFAAAADVVVVMDADLQHDPAYIPSLLAPIQNGEADVCAASRFLTADGADGLSSKGRRSLSLAGVALANRALGLTLSDPLTGFFAFRRDVLVSAAPRLSEQGFKILLDLIVSARPRPRVSETPFAFKERLHGDSKLDSAVLYEFALFLAEKTVGRVVPVSGRFMSFALVGGLGVFVHLAVMQIVFWLDRAVYAGGGAAEAGVFAGAQLAGALSAMSSNFAINNALTYRDRRLRGWGFVRGLVLFALLCSIGLAANVGVASAINARFAPAWALSALAGILVGTVWNYASTSKVVWKARS